MSLCNVVKPFNHCLIGLPFNFVYAMLHSIVIKINLHERIGKGAYLCEDVLIYIT